MAENEQAKWYVVHIYSGHENKVKATIEKAVQNRNMEDIIPRVSVPVEEIVEEKNGKKHTRYRKIFPGYCLVKMIVTDESWYVVRNTKGVTGFVGPNSKPIPLTEQEVINMGLEEEVPVIYKIDFAEGDRVIIKGGAFSGLRATVVSLHPEKGMAKIKVYMFGDRETLVDIEVSQLEKDKEE